jgi:hypothetical protein
MHCLDRALLPLSFAWLALAACSDDGLAPPQETDAVGSTSGTGATTPGESDPGPADSTGPLDPGPASTTDLSDDTATDTGATDGTTGEPPPTMMCEMADQCVLIDDCCQCTAVHVDDPLPACAIDCDVPLCTTLGIPDIAVECVDGYCGLERRNCSGLVACDAAPPPCPAGTLPEVGPGNACWSGACIPVAACDPVPGCDACGEDQACVETTTPQGTTYSCRVLPEACGGVATCACMPDDTCAPPAGDCTDVGGLIQCT